MTSVDVLPISNPLQQWSEVGGSDSVATLQDSSDSTYIQAPSGTASAWYRLAAPVPPADSYFRRWRFRIRMNTQGGGTGSNCRTRFGVAGKYTWDYSGKLTAMADVYSGWSTKPLVLNDVLTIEHRPTHNQGLRPRIAEIALEVQYNEVPVVTVTDPDGSQESSRPMVAATYVDAEGDTISAYEVRVYSSGGYSDGGFEPGLPAYNPDQLWYSGTVSVAGALPEEIQIQQNILTGATYKAFVRVRATDWSNWAESPTFTAAFDPLEAPTISVAVRDYKAVVSGATGLNVLSLNEYSFEGDELAWEGSDIDVTLSQGPDSMNSIVGEQTLSIGIAGGTGVAGMVLSRILPVSPGQLWNYRAYIYNTGLTGDFLLSVIWCDAVGTPVGTASDSATFTVASATTEVLEYAAPVEVPVGVHYCKLALLGDATVTPVSCDVDDVRFWPNDVGSGTRGGLFTNPCNVQLYRLDDPDGEWAICAEPFELDPAVQTFELIDPVPPIAEEVQYRIVIEGTEEDVDAEFFSEPSEAIYLTVPKPADICYLLRDAQDADADAMDVDVSAPYPWRWSEDEQMAKFAALGRKYPLIVADATVRAKMISGMVLEFDDRTKFLAFREIRRNQHVIHLARMVSGVVENMYLRILSDVATTETNTSPIIYKVQFDVAEVGNPYA